MTSPYADPGAVISVAVPGPAQYQNLAAGSQPKLVYKGRCALLGYSWFNSTGAGRTRIWDGTNENGLRVAGSYFAAEGTDTQWFGPAGIVLERGLYVTATVATISGSVYYLPLLD